LIFIAEKEKPETLTELNSILLGKISMVQFINAGIFVILVKWVVNMKNFSVSTGLVLPITLIMILNALTPSLTLLLLNYFQIIRKIKRNLLKKGKIKRTQYEANLLYEGPSTEIYSKYAYVFKTVWLSAFYGAFVPVVVPIGALGLILNYFLEKFLFARAYATPIASSSIVNDNAI
jgi:hypothetical protein